MQEKEEDFPPCHINRNLKRSEFSSRLLLPEGDGLLQTLPHIQIEAFALLTHLHLTRAPHKNASLSFSSLPLRTKGQKSGS